MNYNKIYYTFIDYVKNTSYIERLIKRNKLDNRLVKLDVYTEIHHIIPTSLGGTNDINNLITLLPEEHLFIHKLRYKAFKHREDMLAVRFILNGLNNKTQGNFNKIKLNLTKHILKGYAFIKQESSEFRKIHGWQTPEGKKRISDARKGTFPMKNSITGEIIGSFTKDHPDYISGNLVHHSTGMYTYIDTRTGDKVYISIHDKKDYHKGVGDSSGINNSRWSGITDETIINIHSEISSILGYVTSKPVLLEYASKIYNINIPKSFSSCRFNGSTLIEMTEKNTGLKYNHVKGNLYKEQEQKLKEIYDKN